MMKKHKKVVICAVASKIRVAVFYSKGRLWAPGKKDHGKTVEHYIAVDLTRYHVGQGKTIAASLECLFLTLQATEMLVAEARKNGSRVIRQHVYRKPEVQRDLRRYEKKGRRGGVLIENVNWREWLKKLPA